MMLKLIATKGIHCVLIGKVVAREGNAKRLMFAMKDGKVRTLIELRCGGIQSFDRSSCKLRLIYR
jgi:hypothetical protein